MATSTDYSGPHGKPTLTHAVKTMPKWKWALLGFGLIVGSLGVGSQVASHFLKTPPQTTTQTVVTHSAPASPGSPLPSGSSGFVGGQPQSVSPDVTTTTTTPAQSSPTITDLIAPYMSHFGFSLFVGVVVGLIFRTFLRMAITITALIVGGAMAISYFGHVNIDLTTVKTDTSQAVSWLSTQGYKLRDMLFSALPSSTAAGVGFFLGFKKR